MQKPPGALIIRYFYKKVRMPVLAGFFDFHHPITNQIFINGTDCFENFVHEILFAGAVVIVNQVSVSHFYD